MHAAQLIPLALLAAAPLTGCNANEIAPQRLDHPIVIDGDPSEWGELIVEVEDADYDLGYANDDEYLYLCLITDGDEIRRQVISQGAYIWFDPQGGDERVAGIHYPVGVGGPQMAAGSPPDPGDRESMQTQMQERAAASLQSLEIITLEGAEELELTALQGLEVNSMLTSTSLTIEMRVPLHSLDGANLALGADPAATAIGVELYVPELAAPQRPGGQRSGGMRGGGGGGGGMGGGPPGGGGGRGGGRPGGGQGGGPPQGAEEISEHFMIPLALSNLVDPETSR